MTDATYTCLRDDLLVLACVIALVVLVVGSAK